MKLLFNCINNIGGGGVQNAANFISYALKDNDISFVFLVSPAVQEVLKSWGVESDSVLVFDNRKELVGTQVRVSRIEREFSPDIVYTMAGPSYIYFKSFHVLGISDPYITHARLGLFFLHKNFLSGIKMLAFEVAKGLLARFSGDFFVFQTEASKNGFIRKYWCAQEKTSVVTNALGPAFIEKSYDCRSWSPEGEVKRVLCPSVYYPHKNLEILAGVASLLIESGRTNIKLLVTVSEDAFNAILSGRSELSDILVNIGPFNYSNAMDVYGMADAIVLPSLLETFSAVYIEAVSLGLPLFVPKETFVEDICADYAIYYESLSPESLFDALCAEENGSLLNIKQLERDRILAKYGSQYSRYKNLKSLFNKLLGGG